MVSKRPTPSRPPADRMQIVMGEIVAPDASPPVEGLLDGLQVAAPPEPVKPEPDPETHIELFSIDGRKYYMPRYVSPATTFAYLRDVRRSGTEYALGGLLEKLLGADGLDALANYDAMTAEQMKQLMDAVGSHVMGAIRGE